MTTTTIIQVYPQRTTAKGRLRAPLYLREFIYPGLLSGAKVQVGLTENPDNALTYTDPEARTSTLDLLASLGYDNPTPVPAP